MELVIENQRKILAVLLSTDQMKSKENSYWQKLISAIAPTKMKVLEKQDNLG